MDEGLSFDGAAVIVTGARRGLGAAYSKLLSARGALVVANDLEVADGEPAGLGGERHEERAGTIDVEGSAVDGGLLVERTLARMGRLDGLILNAGFLRDRSFAKASEEDFRDLLDVHLIGPWRAAKAAWPTMVAQGHGRIVLTTSPAGLYGGFGQSGYSAAKAALVGLTRTLAIEGAKHGIGVNCVAPLAASRLSAGVLPPRIPERLPPESIAALVAYLCHPTCTTTGQVFEATGGTIARHAVHRSLGIYLGPQPDLEAVADAWPAIADMSRAESPASSTDSLLRFASRWPDASELGVFL